MSANTATPNSPAGAGSSPSPLFAVARGADGFFRYRAPMKIGNLKLIGTSGGFLTREEAERAAARDAANDQRQADGEHSAMNTPPTNFEPLPARAGSAVNRRRSNETRKHWQVRAYNAATLQFHEHDDVKWKMFKAGWQAAMNSKPVKQNS